MFICPNCMQSIEQDRQPQPDDVGSGEAWKCIKCPKIICVCCYIEHQTKVHPEMYAVTVQNSEGKKKKKGKR